jgi:hypothetical protein
MDQFDAIGADWLIFTIGQNEGYYCSPNRFLDDVLPGRTSLRNLPVEIAQQIKSRHKRFIAYLSVEVAGQEPEVKQAFGWQDGDPTQCVFQLNYQRFIEDFATALDRLVDGWWFDGCYPWPVFPNSNFDFAAYIRAARAGNPEAICAFNDGAFCVGGIAPVTKLEDYHAGEAHMLVEGDIGLGWWKGHPRPYMPTSRFVDGVQWHCLLPVDSTFCGPELPDQHYSDEVLHNLITRINEVDGAITLNLPIGEDGLIPRQTVEQMQRVSSRLSIGRGPNWQGETALCS